MSLITSPATYVLLTSLVILTWVKIYQEVANVPYVGVRNTYGKPLTKGQTIGGIMVLTDVDEFVYKGTVYRPATLQVMADAPVGGEVRLRPWDEC